MGESLRQAAVRETKEETRIDCEITGLVGIYTDPKHVILYTSNGEARQEFSIVLTADAIGGTAVLGRTAALLVRRRAAGTRCVLAIVREGLPHGGP